jgi:hypothetical protein
MAMHNYEREHGRMPPAVVYGADGMPLHSWRVLILPYIGEEELYREFRLDEPWDSPHNIRLLPRMPRTYGPPPGKAHLIPAHHTICHVFVGKGTAFEGREGLRLDKDFPDGLCNTLLIIEAGEPVPWTKPEDLIYEPEGPLPRLDGIFRWGFRVGMGDGSRRHVKKEVSEQTLRAAITRNGGETLGMDW